MFLPPKMMATALLLPATQRVHSWLSSLLVLLCACLALCGHVASGCKVLLYSDALDGGAALKAVLGLNTHNGPNAPLHYVEVRPHAPALPPAAGEGFSLYPHGNPQRQRK